MIRRVTISKVELGFTLLEVLVAMAIFAALSVIAYGGLTQVLQSRQHTEARAEHLARLQTAFHLITKDLQQATNRPIRAEYGETRAAFTGGTSEISLLELTHSGWRNPTAQPRSKLQRIAYRLEAGRLYRHAWQVLDRAQNTQSIPRKLLDDIDQIGLRFLDSSRRWRNSWPPPKDSAEAPVPALPLAIELTLEIKPWGVIKRLIQVVDA